jgi:8-amino-7-oxononanoate synthase
MHEDINQYIKDKIQFRKENDSFRVFKLNEGIVDFCSNDYLGFAKDKQFAIEAHQLLMQQELRVNGNSGARTITGTSKEILSLESTLAKHHLAESALLYNSGYTANVGLFSSLPYRGDTIIYDELIHASIRDGMQLSKAKSFSFLHNDLASLEKKLSLATGRIYVVVESIYSMDGDTAPLKSIAELCSQYDAALIVDEAHSNGIYGKDGAGLVVELGLEKTVFARVITFGKALGCHGAAVLGSQDLTAFLINFSRSFIYTTAPAPHQVLSLKIAYDNLSKVENKRLILSKLIALFKLKIKEVLNVDLIESSSPIQCLIIPGNSVVKQVCSGVQDDGFDVRPIVAPTVPVGKERIRICLHSYNTEDEVIALVTSLKKRTQHVS